jgi:hypothetical protein
MVMPSRGRRRYASQYSEGPTSREWKVPEQGSDRVGHTGQARRFRKAPDATQTAWLRRPDASPADRAPNNENQNPEDSFELPVFTRSANTPAGGRPPTTCCALSRASPGPTLLNWPRRCARPQLLFPPQPHTPRRRTGARGGSVRTLAAAAAQRPQGAPQDSV